MRRIIVGYSGGVTSAWAALWAIERYPKSEVVFLFHDTQEEDADTYRFLRDFAAKVGHPITDRSDGRSVTQVMRDEGMLANNRVAFCSRILKAEQFERYRKECVAEGVTEIVKVLGFTGGEWARIQRHTMMAEAGGFVVRFPLVEEKVSKQDAADLCIAMGVPPSSMYLWSDHANCPGCMRGGRAYWLAVKENAPDVWAQRVALEEEFGHTVINGISLPQLAAQGLKRRVDRKEAIDIGPCECGS